MELDYELLTPYMEQIIDYGPRLAGALAILLVGWLVALILSSVVKGLLDKTDIDNKLARWIGGEESDIPIEHIMGTITYYLVMLFTLVGFFQTLGLEMLTGPLQGLLDRVFHYIPSLLGGFLVLGVAIIAATMARTVLHKILSVTKFDSRLKSEMGLKGDTPDDPETISLSRTISETVYWLILLLFLPMVLDAFELHGVLAPINTMVEEVVGFLPNLFSAGILITVGLILSRIMQKIVSNLARVANVDGFMESIGIKQMMGANKMSDLLGLLAYAFFFVPILISALEALSLEAISKPATMMLSMIMSAIPLLFGAVIIISVAFIVGKFAGALVTKLLTGIGFNRVFALLGLHSLAESENTKSASQILGTVTHAAVVLFGVTEAFNILGFESLNVFVHDFLELSGQILIGLVILGFGLFIANWSSQTIRQSGSTSSIIMANAARIAILFVTGAMALRQMGLANEIVQMAFGLLLGAFALASAIAFGIGGREVAARQLEKWTQKMEGHSMSSV